MGQVAVGVVRERPSASERTRVFDRDNLIAVVGICQDVFCCSCGLAVPGQGSDVAVPVVGYTPLRE